MVKRRTYTSLRIDFTPFVSIALLLIVFFMWVKTAEKPTLLQMNAPSDFCCYDGEYLDADATVYLLAKNQVGFLPHRNTATELTQIDYSAEGIRKELLGITLNHDYGAIVLITPTEQATFKNLVDILDELRIVGHIRYKLNNYPTTEERRMIAEYKCYKATYSVVTKSVHLSLYSK